MKWRKTNTTDAKGQKYNLVDVPEEDSECPDAFKPRKALENWLKVFFSAYNGEESFYSAGHDTSNMIIFPDINMKGKISFGKEMDKQKFRLLMQDTMVAAGIDRKDDSSRTLHTFRRGGFQDKFIFQKPRWNLRVCRWWGGWGVG